MGVNLEDLCDLCTPWCLQVAVTLRIAEHIRSAKSDIGELAAAVKCDRYVLHRMMKHLVSKGVFEETRAGYFSLNEAAQGLLDPRQRIGLDLNGIGGRMAGSWGTMLQYVQTGAPAYAGVFGRPFWEDLDAHPEVGASFDDLIGPMGHGAPNAEFKIEGGWDDVRTVMDLGGGTGAMLAGILRLHPNIQGTLLDLPRTVASAGPIFDEAGVRDRVTMVGQSFLDPLPAGADIYLLRGVLNDWPDKDVSAILRRCAVAAGDRGRVVVLKSVGELATRGGLTIEMILLGGKHRTVEEFAALARGSGLEVVSAGRQENGYCVVECRSIVAVG